MMRTAILALLVTAAVAAAQISGPSSATFPIGSKNPTVTVTVNADSAKYKIIGLGAGLDAFREFEGIKEAANRLKIRIDASVAGEGHIIVVGVKAGELLDIYDCHVVVTGTPTPPPGPGPTPPPPGPGPSPGPPVDPFVAQIQAAADADGFPRASLADVAVVVNAAANGFTVGATAQRTHDWLKLALVKGPRRGPKLDAILASKTTPVLQSLLAAPDSVLTTTSASELSRVFSDLGTALQAASGK